MNSDVYDNLLPCVASQCREVWCYITRTVRSVSWCVVVSVSRWSINRSIGTILCNLVRLLFALWFTPQRRRYKVVKQADPFLRLLIHCLAIPRCLSPLSYSTPRPHASDPIIRPHVCLCLCLTPSLCYYVRFMPFPKILIYTFYAALYAPRITGGGNGGVIGVVGEA